MAPSLTLSGKFLDRKGASVATQGGQRAPRTRGWVQLLPCSCTGPGCGSSDTRHPSTCSEAEGLAHPSLTQARSYAPAGQQGATDANRSGQLTGTRAEKTLFVRSPWTGRGLLPSSSSSSSCGHRVLSRRGQAGHGTSWEAFCLPLVASLSQGVADPWEQAEPGCQGRHRAPRRQAASGRVESVVEGWLRACSPAGHA